MWMLLRYGTGGDGGDDDDDGGDDSSERGAQLRPLTSIIGE